MTMTRPGKLELFVVAIVALGLLLAPAVTAYAQRQRGSRVEAVDPHVLNRQRVEAAQRAREAAQRAREAACLQRRNANDPSELIGTEACAPVAVPLSAYETACLRRASADDPSELIGTEACGPAAGPQSPGQALPAAQPAGTSGARSVNAAKAPPAQDR
jgi:hypothetical protein